MQFTIDVRGAVISHDGVSATIEAAVTFQASLLDSLRRRKSVTRAVLSSLRSIVGQRELDDLLHGEDFGLAVLAMMNDTSVTAVQILSVSVPAWLEESLAAEVVAERERRAKLTGAEAEFQAAARLAEAAAALKVPAAYLRWLTMLERVGRLDMRAEIVGPSMVPDPKPVAKPVDSKVAAGLRAIRNQKRGEEWVGAALGGAGRP